MNSFASAVAVPVELQETLAANLQKMTERLAALNLEIPSSHVIGETLPKVWACSAFVADHCIQRPDMLIDLIDSGDLTSVYDARR